MLKIGYEAKFLQSKNTGVGYYFLNLLSALLQIDSENIYRLYVRETLDLLAPNLVQRRRWFPGRILHALWWHLPLLPIESFLGSLDIFHSPYIYMPYVRHARTVMTVPDLAFLKLPNIYDRSQLRDNLANLRYKERANHFIAISDWTKRDVVEQLGIDSKRVTTIHLGVDHGLFVPAAEDETAEFRLRHSIDTPYFVYVGTLEPRKNITGLLRAFDRFCSLIDGSVSLFLVGKKGWLYDDIFAAWRKMSHGDRVKFVGYADLNELRLWYGSALAFVYPSLYEGFGLPNLEAMACGAPVISSSVSSIPEVVGDAALLVDPRSEEELTGALRRMYENSHLRTQLRNAGLARAQHFTWEKCARETLGFYGSIL